MTPALARELRRETGRSFMGLVRLLGEDPDLDVIAEAVWVARRIAGEDIPLDDVAITYNSLDDDFDIQIAEPSEVDGSPEA